MSHIKCKEILLNVPSNKIKFSGALLRIVTGAPPRSTGAFHVKYSGIWPGSLVNLNNNKQILELKGKGEKYIDGYIFRMEEYFPYITEHLSSFISYWNGKLRDLVGEM